MRFSVTLVSPDLGAVHLAQSRVAQALASAGATLLAPQLLGPPAIDMAVEAPDDALPALRRAALDGTHELPVDVCVQPAEGRRKTLFVADMDSTIIGCECLDELADFAGVKERVAAITERAMRGELPFEAALRERVAMIAGLPLSDLERCYEERVRLNPGARTLVQTMAANCARCVLVTGGFTVFALKVAEAAGFHAARANWLKEADGKLTGEVGEPILGRQAKLDALVEESAALDQPLSAALAVGDGANDLGMIEAAGLGVAYRAKPVTAEKADARVDHADLTALLYFQGYSVQEFAS